MINYNNDVNSDELATVDYNNDTNPNNLNNDIEKIDLKKKSATRIAAKEIIKNYKNIKKGQLVNYSKLNKKSKDDYIVFIKPVSVHSRDRFRKLAGTEDKVEFFKQVPVHPRDRLRGATNKSKTGRS